MSYHRICFFNRKDVHYRKGIYLQMEKDLNVDFFFGDSRNDDVRGLDLSLLKNYKGTFHNINIGPFYWQKGVFSLLKKNYTDIITTGDTYCISTWIMYILAPIFGKKIYLWTIGAMGGEKWFERIVIWLKFFLVNGAFIYGNRGYNLLKKYGVNPIKLAIIYNSLSYNEQIELRKKAHKTKIFYDHFNNNYSNLIFIGRLAKRRKLNMIIEAMEILKRRGLPFNLTLLGDGEMRKELEMEAEKRDLQDSIWFYGSIYDESIIANFLYNADLLVSPGSIGLTAIHALTYGCPVLTHNNFNNLGPEYESIENGVNGLFFEENNIDSLAIQIEKWFNTHKDRDIIRNNCYYNIDNYFNPQNQTIIMKKLICK